MYNLTQSVHALWMNGVCEVANRVQLMPRSSECAHWLSLAYFCFAHFTSLLLLTPLLLFYFLLSFSSVPQPRLSPSFSGSQLYKGVWLRVSEWVSTLEAVNTLSTPAERWHLDVLDSKLLLFHDATRCNYSNIFALYPAAPATVKRVGSWRSWDISLSVPSRSCKDRLTDSNWGDQVQSEKRGSHSSIPKDSVNSCILLEFLFWEHSAVCLEGCWLTVRVWQSFVVVVGAGERASCSSC